MLAPTHNRPRIGTLREQRPAWAYFLSRRRQRLVEVPPFNSPPDIDGLKLWLDAGVGTLTAWADAPAAGYSWGDYSGSSGYLAYGYTHTIRVVPFKTEDGQRVYSAARLEHAFTDSGVTTSAPRAAAVRASSKASRASSNWPSQ